MAVRGELFIEKFNRLSPGYNLINCLHDGYGVLAKMHVKVKLTNDANFRYGMLLEKCCDLWGYNSWVYC